MQWSQPPLSWALVALACICGHFASRDWNVCAVCRSPETAEGPVPRDFPQALVLSLDAAEPTEFDRLVGLPERLHASAYPGRSARASSRKGYMPRRGGQAPDPSDAATTDAEVADAVCYLAVAAPRALTHELQITPSGDRWVP